LANQSDEVAMSRLDLARDRLREALENLEKTAKERGKRAAKVAPETAARLQALEAEREQLLGRVAELEEELAALSSVTSEVEGRLDGAIGEIRAALARQ
jgi:chromosome segregation ATPase